MIVYDNPEPSHLLMEGVETGRRECIICNSELVGSQRKFCSKKCASRLHSYH
jgi:predicted nucleic acid-binding Zn ribbon protein